MRSPFCLDRQLLGVRQDGACSFCPKPTCPGSPAGPPSATASPAAPAHRSPSGSQAPCPAPSPRGPLRGRPASPPSAPQGLRGCRACPPTACSLPPPPLPSCPLGPSAADTPVSSRHLDHAGHTVPSGSPKGRPGDHCPHQGQRSQGPETVPSPSRGAGGAGGLALADLTGHPPAHSAPQAVREP